MSALSQWAKFTIVEVTETPVADLVKAYNGVISSHLFPDCPFIEKWKQGEFGTPGVGKYRGTWVDPEGVDVCSECYRRWRDAG